ncbi:hypothetical protein FDECE_17759, partial [Fusarium decemcellulare]
MRFSVASALAMASTVSGHALMYGVSVNGEDQGDGQNVYIRTPPNNSPVKDLSSPDIVCNVNGAKAAPKFVSAAAEAVLLDLGPDGAGAVGLGVGGNVGDNGALVRLVDDVVGAGVVVPLESEGITSGGRDEL